MRHALADPSDAAPSLAPQEVKSVRLADYAPPAWLVDRVDLVVKLDPKATRVEATLAIRRNPAAAEPERPDLRLDGRALKLLSVDINGEPVAPEAISVDAEGLTTPASALPSDAFTWRAVTEIKPRDNTALEGLYMSRDMFCSQCEAQGFRKITYFPDRPDVLSVYRCRIEADAAAYPILLSNGEVEARGALNGGRHFVTWADPWPKPSYLFALVAGDLAPTNETFTTRSGQRVTLTLFTRPGDEAKAPYALDALKRAMAWDEATYGREYDLSLFMIVAVDDFNMGAMENKGLNIFNSRYVLATPETATDRDYELIESVIAHEYFHNWTGNRVTCRDWFQLCLKEGLTVFRDQQFSEDMRGAAVQRIEAVRALRARQFREDAGPLAHPVRPETYIEINNFYTTTVYEKGAEIVRMLRTLFGAEVYRAALDLYFARHDGEAATIEAFVACFEEAGGVDLSHFALWWRQAGTPRVAVEESFDADARTYRVTLTQTTPPTPGQPEKEPLVIPLRYGLLRQDGGEILRPEEVEDPAAARERRVLLLDQPSKSFEIRGVDEKPILALNRGFSAPVIVEQAVSAEENAVLLGHEPDPYRRWEAGRALGVDAVLSAADDIAAGESPRAPAALGEALASALEDHAADPAFKALLLALPGEDELHGERGSWRGARAGASALVDPDAIHAARRHVRRALAERLAPLLERAYADMAVEGAYRPNQADAAKRALRNAAMALLAARDTAEDFARARDQFDHADNMTEQLPALTALAHGAAAAAPAALEQFYLRWRSDPLVLGKWFGVQATAPLPNALETVERLTRHPDFDWRNPNKFRALIGAFAMGNTVGFHAADGSGYRFLADWLLRLDPVNPQTAAKLVAAFETWARYDEERQTLMRGELKRIAAAPKLSRDVGEMVTRILG